MTKRTLLVAVNYNTPEETIEYVRSLSYLQQAESLLVLIVENSKQELRTPELKGRLTEIIKDLIFVETPENKNYFGSVNYGLAITQLRPADFDYFIISNVDILVNDTAFLTKLYGLAVEQTGMIAPSVFSLLKEGDQNPYLLKRFRKSYFYYYRIIYQHILFTMLHEKVVTSLRQSKPKTEKPKKQAERQRIFAAHGAFMIFLKAFFENGNSIDFGNHLYAEEIFVAEQCRRNGLAVMYEPSIQVIHSEHISTGTLSGDSRRKIKLKTMKYFLKNM